MKRLILTCLALSILLAGGPLELLAAETPTAAPAAPPAAVSVAPQNDPTHFLYSVKDATIFRDQDSWQVDATAFMMSGPAATELLNSGVNQPATGQQRPVGGGGRSMVQLSLSATVLSRAKRMEWSKRLVVGRQGSCRAA